MNTTLEPKQYAKKAVKAKRSKKSKTTKKQKKVVKGNGCTFTSSFLKSWLLEPNENYSNRILQTLSPYRLSFQERYTRILYFNKVNEYEKIFIEAEKARQPEKKYKPNQFDCLNAYRANQSLRWAFKKLFLAWKHRKLQLVNDTDIITMEPLKTPIFICNYSTNKKYQVEAKSLLVDSLNRLFLHDDFFPKSKVPRNLLTNEELTFSQLWSCSLQMKKYGITHWCWEAFASSSFNLEFLLADYETPMKYEMVKRCFSDTLSSDANWYVSELIGANTTGITAKALKWAVYHQSSHRYMLKWRDLCQIYWKVAVIQGETEAENTSWIQARLNTLLEDVTSIKEIKRLYFEPKT